MATAISERLKRIHQLDHIYHEGLHHIELINRDESERRFSLKVLALRDANAALEHLVSEKELHIFYLEKTLQNLRSDLSETKQRSSQLESGLHNQRSEIRFLKADIENLNSSVNLSAGALHDNATLTRELDSLRQELEQLKLQLASHEAIVASNGELRRRINSMEVDLENEMRSKLRAQQMGDKGVISDLRSKLQKCENKLNAEKEEKESLKQELTDSRRETEHQQEQVTKMRSKLKELQSTLKDAQMDLQQSQCELSKARETSTDLTKKPHPKAPKVRLPRVIMEPPISTVETCLDDMDIQTPGNENISDIRQHRRRALEHAQLGEKSKFSITPFLNKTRDATEYPDLDSDKSASDVDSEASPEQPHARRRGPSRTTTTAKARRPIAIHRKPSSSSRKNTAETRAVLSKPVLNDPNSPAKYGTKKRAQLRKATDAVRANSDEENSGPDTASQKSEPKPLASTTREVDEPKATGPEADGRKKKRKLLGGGGKTIFDDDEVGNNDRPGNQLRVASAKRGRAQLGSVANAFAAPGSTFSPLKRERRGANASFIG
ncbi:hypothetical protein G3M48_004144 [Beauveria asiatica]|uniref:Rossmann-fold NAD(P)(+)-binding protein n=1 Tax=Beauveria asiatica TaxID=1069075 RepID=A0AAW0S7E3_9HYPO